MQIVAVTRILNEDDIVEAFVRHHRPEIDHHLFLDNGSVDRTLEILRALQAEGFPLTVLQNAAPYFAEVSYNTNLFIQAIRSFGADWVVFLDTDEFVDSRHFPPGLRARLESMPESVQVLSLRSRMYYDGPHDPVAETVVPRRLRWRERVVAGDNTKVIVRGRLAGLIEIEAGQHAVTYQGKVVETFADDLIWLAHYYRRGPYQAVAKSVMGHLKVLAAGQAETDRMRSFHYGETFAAMRDAPGNLLRNPGFLAPVYADRDLVEDPIAYAGGALRYFAPSDAAMKAVRVLTAYAEALARHAGKLADTNEGVRLMAEKAASVWVKLF